MTQDDKAKFLELLTAVMSQYNRDLTTGMIHLWWEGLQRYDYAAVRKAFSVWLQNPDEGQFAPTIAGIIKMIGGTTGDAGAWAWTKVDKAVRQVGHYRSVVFDDPIIHRVIDDMGGWIRLASLPSDDDLKFAGIEFAKRYRSYVLAGVDAYPARLIGAAEAQNSARGFIGHYDVARIGDEEKCLRIENSGSQAPLLKITTEQREGGKPIAIGQAVKRIGQS